MKFRKKPVEIEAVQVKSVDYNGKTLDGCPFTEAPQWIMDAIANEMIVLEPSHETDYAIFRIKTLEDGPKEQVTHIAVPGDWIIKGVRGELYPCKDEIFKETYMKIVEY